jgi:hypothetical protein
MPNINDSKEESKAIDRERSLTLLAIVRYYTDFNLNGTNDENELENEEEMLQLLATLNYDMQDIKQLVSKSEIHFHNTRNISKKGLLTVLNAETTEDVVHLLHIGGMTLHSLTNWLPTIEWT